MNFRFVPQCRPLARQYAAQRLNVRFMKAAARRVIQTDGDQKPKADLSMGITNVASDRKAALCLDHNKRQLPGRSDVPLAEWPPVASFISKKYLPQFPPPDLPRREAGRGCCFEV